MKGEQMAEKKRGSDPGERSLYRGAGGLSLSVSRGVLASLPGGAPWACRNSNQVPKINNSGEKVTRGS